MRLSMRRARMYLLTARAECYLVEHPNALQESIRRLQAYAEAGADVLYAPGPRSAEDIQAIVKAVSPKPVNVLMSSNTGSEDCRPGGHGSAPGERRFRIGTDCVDRLYSRRKEDCE